VLLFAPSTYGQHLKGQSTKSLHAEDKREDPVGPYYIGRK
jgi:hypothetical protein